MLLKVDEDDVDSEAEEEERLKQEEKERRQKKIDLIQPKIDEKRAEFNTIPTSKFDQWCEELFKLEDEIWRINNPETLKQLNAPKEKKQVILFIILKILLTFIRDILHRRSTLCRNRLVILPPRPISESSKKETKSTKCIGLLECTMLIKKQWNLIGVSETIRTMM